MADVRIEWPDALPSLKTGRKVDVRCLGFHTEGTIRMAVMAPGGILEITLANPLRRKCFTSGPSEPAIFNVLRIDTTTSKVFEIENGTRLYITLPHADHATIG